MVRRCVLALFVSLYMNYIYALADPITDNICYVGKTNNLNKRKSEHNYLNREISSHKKNWIQKLKKNGLSPNLIVLDEVDEDWIYWESYWIAQMRTWGFDLLNHTNGGDGGFANSGSFRKGRVPWNKGKGFVKSCIVCSTSYFSNRGANKKTCSRECANQHRKNLGIKPPQHTIPWNKGRTYSSTRSRKVLQLDFWGNIVQEHNSCKEAALRMGCISETIRRACSGAQKTAKNFKWKYKDE